MEYNFTRHYGSNALRTENIRPPFKIDTPEERGWKLWSWVHYTCWICSGFKRLRWWGGRILNFKTNVKQVVEENERKRFVYAPKMLYCSLEGHWGNKLNKVIKNIQTSPFSLAALSPLFHLQLTFPLQHFPILWAMKGNCFCLTFLLHQKACGETMLVWWMSLSHSVTDDHRGPDGTEGSLVDYSFINLLRLSSPSPNLCSQIHCTVCSLSERCEK